MSVMEGLQILQVELGLSQCRHPNINLEYEILTPLMSIKQVKKFVVNIIGSMHSFIDPEQPFELNHIDPETHKFVPYDRTGIFESRVV